MQYNYEYKYKFVTDIVGDVYYRNVCLYSLLITIVLYIVGSSAEIAGLQKNDCIVRINGQNVSRTGSDGVAKLVR